MAGTEEAFLFVKINAGEGADDSLSFEGVGSGPGDKHSKTRQIIWFCIVDFTFFCALEFLLDWQQSLLCVCDLAAGTELDVSFT